MKIVVDRNIRAARSTFGKHAELVFMEGRAIRNRDLRDADALIVRTATQVNEPLLRGTTVGFVGTTSIGTDHLDIEWLDRSGIPWANAPGCNAVGAAQYTLATAWLACKRLGRRLAEQRVGIIGYGNVGSRTGSLTRALGVQVVANDPPLAAQGQKNLVDLEQTLSMDIVCLHLPLTRGGRWPTLRLIGERELARMPDGALLINAGRGDTVDGKALLAELRSGRLHAALDVWPAEPVIDPDLLEATTVATPHVAGYSLDGKRKGTVMVYEAFCRWAGVEPVDTGHADDERRGLTVPAGDDGLAEALEAACFVARHDRAMRELAHHSSDERATGFDRLRRDYPTRRDFQAWTVRCPDPATTALLARLGFNTSS